MRIPFFSFTIIFLFFFTSSFAQLKRANQYYDNYDYPKAIQLYKKVIKKNENSEALEKIANSYRLIKNYPQAELYYATLMKQATVEPINHFFYGMVLKNNNKIDEAREQFKLYSTAAPDDKKAEISVKSCDDIKIWVSKTQQFDVSPVENINSAHSEFGPFVYKNQLVFVSDRSRDMVNNDNYTWNKQPFLNVYSSEISIRENGTVTFSKKTKSFSAQINSDYHDGPVCFNAEQNTIYLTRVDYEVNKKDKNFVNRAKIFISTLNGKTWSKVKPFQYNSDAYSVAHPFISIDGQYLFFASDMPGGSGGMDIYVCKKEAESWGQPQNLGTEVNTPDKEVFPYIRKDGILYFSSDGHGGFGGLDVYSATKIDENYSDVKNLGAPLNSSTDDFGIIFSDDNTKGYFSSDRATGKGADDIYSFIALNKFLTVSGKILFSQNLSDPAMNAKIMLITRDGKVISISSTDSTGFFKFEKLDPDEKYMVKLDETDPVFAAKKKYYMADSSGKIIRVTVINDKGGKFVFMNLPADPNSLPELGLGDDVSIAGNLLFGENPSKPLANTRLNLVNEKSEIVQSTTTNSFGAFVFTDLPPDKNFMVKVDENDTNLPANTKITITNKKGKEMQSTTSGKTGTFKFSFLAADSNTMVEMGGSDVSISGKLMFGENSANPLANKKVNLVNEKGEIMQTVTTDATGAFIFTDLPPDNNYLVKVDENDTDLSPNTKISITNKNGKEIQSTTSDKNGSFNFALLASDSNTLVGMIPSTDVAISGNLMFGENSANPLANKKVNLVNEKGEIIQTVTTDATGGFTFTGLPPDNNYLVKVDESDTDLAPNTKITITNKSGKEMLATTTGEKGDFNFAFLASDKHSLKSMAVEDSELKFDLNGKIVTENKSPLIFSVVNLINEKGEIIQTTKTDKNGKFKFTNLPADQNYLFALDENDSKLSTHKKLFLTNEKGKIIKEFVRVNGKFKFTILPSDQQNLGAIYVEDTWLKEILVTNKIQNEKSNSKLNNIPGNITTNDSLHVENIYYAFGAVKIAPEAFNTLDNIISTMKNDKQLNVVISSHTDSRSSGGFNIKLSQKRTETVINYFTSKGINRMRILGKRFGETSLVNNCTDFVECTEEEHAKNRRTEIKLVKKQK